MSEPPFEKKVNLEKALAQLLTSHTTFMNETNEYAEPGHPIEQSSSTVEKLRGANWLNGQSVDGKAAWFFSKQFRGKPKRRKERVLQG